MYGFWDDRNPANDAVNVMEEILIEYILDVVRPVSPHPILSALHPCLSLSVHIARLTSVWRSRSSL